MAVWLPVNAKSEHRHSGDEVVVDVSLNWFTVYPWYIPLCGLVESLLPDGLIGVFLGRYVITASAERLNADMAASTKIFAISRAIFNSPGFSVSWLQVMVKR